MCTCSESVFSQCVCLCEGTCTYIWMGESGCLTEVLYRMKLCVYVRVFDLCLISSHLSPLYLSLSGWAWVRLMCPDTSNLSVCVDRCTDSNTEETSVAQLSSLTSSHWAHRQRLPPSIYHYLSLHAARLSWIICCSACCWGLTVCNST
jgi:hypothetical protein